MNICIIGTGYVGLVTGASLAYLDNSVCCVDIDRQKISRLKAGQSPIFEPGIEELIESGIKAGRLSFTTDLDEAMLNAEVIFIAVGTPPLADGSSDLSYVKSAAQGIGRGILANHGSGLFKIIINKSTVPVGSGNWVEMIVREQVRSLIATSVFKTDIPNNDRSQKVREMVDEISSTFTVVSNPEFLREGTAISDTFYPDRIVIGANDERAFQVLERLYRPLLDQSFDPPPSILSRPKNFGAVPLVTTDLTSAEMIKYAANAFLAMKISFANEIANVCEQTGADILRVMQGIGLDERIGTGFLNAGIGWGGSCFGKDISALIQIAREYNYHPQLLEAVSAVNRRQRSVLIQKLQGALKIIKGRTIGLLGLSFKPNTDDVRDAPSFDIASELVKMGARVKVYDPVAMDSFRAQHPDLDLIYAPNVTELADDCDALVVVTEWEEFRQLDLKSLHREMTGCVLVDGRNVFDAAAATAVGFNYIGIGR